MVKYLSVAIRRIFFLDGDFGGFFFDYYRAFWFGSCCGELGEQAAESPAADRVGACAAGAVADDGDGCFGVGPVGFRHVLVNDDGVAPCDCESLQRFSPSTSLVASATMSTNLLVSVLPALSRIGHQVSVGS